MNINSWWPGPNQNQGLGYTGNGICSKLYKKNKGGIFNGIGLVGYQLGDLDGFHPCLVHTNDLRSLGKTSATWHCVLCDQAICQT